MYTCINTTPRSVEDGLSHSIHKDVEIKDIFKDVSGSTYQGFSRVFRGLADLV